MRAHRPAATIIVLLATVTAGVARSATTDRAETWLREGADLAVSTSADGEHIVFGLIGRIWSLNAADGFATQLSADEEIARHPSVSPDGQLVAYETVRGGYVQVIVRDADGRMARQITFGEFNHRSPAWSPQGETRPVAGRRLIMSSDRGGRYGIWEIDIDTLDLQQLTFASSDEREPAWNADGSRLAYVTDTADGTALYAVRPGEQPQLLLSEKATIRAPAWRPGGGLLTYVRQLNGESQLRMLLLSQPAITKPITHDEDAFAHPARWLDRSSFLYTADGQIRRRRFGERNADTIAFNARVAITKRSWSPLELLLDEHKNQPVTGSNGITVADDGRFVIAALGDLWEIRPDGTLLRQLTSDPFVDAQPAISPDGRNLAFVSDRGGSLQVWLLDLETSQMRRLTRESGIALHPDWARDGKSIAYDSAMHFADTRYQRKFVDLDGAAETDGEPPDTGMPEELHKPDAAPEPTRRAFDGAAVVPLTWKPFMAKGRRIIRAGRIFDGLGPGYIERHEIVLDGNRIDAIRPWTTDSPSDDNVEIIDARDSTVMPGLIDLSVRQSPIGDERLGRKYLAYGVTAIRENVTNPAEAVERHESWRSGRRIGPRLFMTSTLCSDAPDRFVVRPVLEPAVAQLAFRTQVNAAIDRGSVAIGVCPSMDSGARVDVIAATHARGLPAVAADALPDILMGADQTRPPPADLAGYDDFALIAGRLGTSVTSNLATHGLPMLIGRGEFTTGWQYRQLFTRADQDWYGRTWNLSADGHAAARIRLHAVRTSVVDALTSGARVVTGSDTPSVPPGLGLHAELRLLVDAGLQPFQALRAATLDAGRTLGAGGQLGTIRPGAIADVVIVDGDPLANIRDAASVSMTIAAGRPYSRRELGARGSRPTSVGKLYN